MGTTRLRWGLVGDNDGVAFVGRQRIWLAAWGRGSVVGVQSWGTKKGCAAPRVGGRSDICVVSNALFDPAPASAQLASVLCVFGLVEGGISFDRSFGEKRSAESMQH